MNLYFIFIGLFASVLYALSIVIQKEIFSNTNIPSYVFTLVSTFIASLLGLLLIYIYNIDIFSNFYFISQLVIAGSLYGISLILYYYALEKDEATRVSQLAGLEVVVVPTLAILILQESPSLKSILGISLIILAILILTIGKNMKDIINITKVAAIPIGICLIIWATQDMIMKSVLYSKDFLFVYFWVRLSSLIILLLVLGIRTKTRKEIFKLKNTVERYNLGVFIITAIISSFALLLTIITYSLGPLSIASPLISSYPLFVPIFLYMGHKLFGYDIQASSSTKKQILSSVLFVFGIVIIHININSIF